jgi:ABC-type multidrug transport system ATPase subunit
LYRYVADSYIGDERVRGISGGQKRRVTLARGFVGGSQIVFAVGRCTLESS